MSAESMTAEPMIADWARLPADVGVGEGIVCDAAPLASLAQSEGRAMAGNIPLEFVFVVREVADSGAARPGLVAAES